MQHSDAAKFSPCSGGIIPKEIISRLIKGNFVDDHGHRLDMCEDFHRLIALVNTVDIETRK